MGSFSKLIYIISIYAFLILFSLVFIKGMPYRATDYSGKYLSLNLQEKIVQDPVQTQVTDLLIYQGENEVSVTNLKQYREILKEMKAGVDERELSEVDFDDLGAYSRVLLDLPDLSKADSCFEQICDYVRGGGQLLVWCPPDCRESQKDWNSLLGISALNETDVTSESFYPVGDFMVGGERNYIVKSSNNTAVNVSLTEDCNVYAKDQTRKMPLVWERNPGKGRVVVCNYPDCYKLTRGIFSSAYSLLGDVCAWPVINAQAFFLDDFPAPTNSEVSVDNITGGKTLYQNFVSDQWWPDIHALGQKYDLSFTAGIIETYDIPKDGQIRRNTDLTGFNYFGRAVTYDGGELCLHGYNHQPLAGPDYQYAEDIGYRTWESYSEMIQALSELDDFANTVYPDSNPTVYVPPSNILPEQGREMIGTSFPEIRTIASTYLEGPDAYTQEFGVADDGIIETPRLTSGENMNDRSMLLACSELNFHYVNTHFIHPDDIMDKNRTGSQKWIFLRDRLDQYLGYLQQSAPNIRHLTGSGLAGAVQRYYYVVPEIQVTDSKISIDLANHTDTEYVMLRINNGRKPGEVVFGNIEELTGDLYLVTCQADHVEINLE